MDGPRKGRKARQMSKRSSCVASGSPSEANVERSWRRSLRCRWLKRERRPDPPNSYHVVVERLVWAVRRYSGPTGLEPSLVNSTLDGSVCAATVMTFAVHYTRECPLRTSLGRGVRTTTLHFSSCVALGDNCCELSTKR